MGSWNWGQYNVVPLGPSSPPVRGSRVPNNRAPPVTGPPQAARLGRVGLEAARAGTGAEPGPVGRHARIAYEKAPFTSRCAEPKAAHLSFRG